MTNTNGKSIIPDIIARQEADLLEDWMRELAQTISRRESSMRMNEQRELCTELLRQLRTALQSGNLTDVFAPEWGQVREILEEFSRSRGRQGYSPTETATFLFSLKRPLFTRLRQACDDVDTLFSEIWVANLLLDRLGLYTTEVFQKSREEIINRQQQEMLELSTPVVKLWDGILALPMIGTLDSGRTQIVMESLLQKLVETGSQLAIIDITGVPTVDTLVAQHLLKTVAAARLMGAECIISGIRPQIAQTIVHLGVDLGNVITKASLADAFKLALTRTGLTMSRVQPKV